MANDLGWSIAVADTSPLNYLIQIGSAGLLSRLFASVVIPTAVRHELSSSKAPAIVSRWIDTPPSWITVASPGDELDQNLESLGRGEGEAIQLLEQIQADILLIDERLGRRIAENRGIKAAGTLGVLRDAHHMGWADAFALYASLKTKTTFRVSPQLEQRFLNSLR